MNVLRPVHWREHLGAVPYLDVEWGEYECATCGPIGHPRALPLGQVVAEHLSVFHRPTHAPTLLFECERSECPATAAELAVFDDGPDGGPLAVYVCVRHASDSTGAGPWEADKVGRNYARQQTFSATVRALRDRQGVR